MNFPLTEAHFYEWRAIRACKRVLLFQIGGGLQLQPTSDPAGATLTAQCEGSRAPSYRLHAEMDEGGGPGSCTCSYDRGGECKHIVALLLIYVCQPDEVLEQNSVTEVHVGLEKHDLVALIVRLVKRDPDIFIALDSASLGNRRDEFRQD